MDPPHKESVKVIGTWDELLHAHDEIPQKPLIFRAEKYTENPLQTSLDKAFFDCRIKNVAQRSKIERALIQRFRRQCHLHADLKLVPQNNLEVVALMRHYGAPTRALDWTGSFFAAVYFAINRRSAENAVVWCLDKEYLSEKVQVVHESFLDADDYRKEHNLERTKMNYYKDWNRAAFNNYVFHFLLNKNPERFIYAATPYYLNDRLAVQQGALLFACDISKTWKENLDAMITADRKKPDEVYTKVILSNEEATRQEFLTKLYEMNINQSSLFPGLAGFAEGLTNQIAHDTSLYEIGEEQLFSQ